MTFSPATRTLSGVPPASDVGMDFYVKMRVTTPSGGTDSFILKVHVTVTPPLVPGAAQSSVSALRREGPNPTHGEFLVMAPGIRTQTVTRSIFDLSGRRVAVVKGPGGSPLIWDGTDQDGAKVGGGIYLYRMEGGGHRREGKVVVVR